MFGSHKLVEINGKFGLGILRFPRKSAESQEICYKMFRGKNKTCRTGEGISLG